MLLNIGMSLIWYVNYKYLLHAQFISVTVLDSIEVIQK
jgi:hypothetical protein